jgi:effector-binding domain-containing protein
MIGMEYHVRLEQHPGLPLAVVRRRASMRELARVVPDACGTVWGVVRAQKVEGAGRHVAVYWDDQINLEVGVELAAPFAGFGDVVGSATPAGPVATTTHYGPYGQLHHAHEAIRRWCGSNGYMPAGPNWEIYGHWKDEWNSDPAKICTDIFYLLVAGDGSEANLAARPLLSNA